MITKTAILIINHNTPELGDNLFKQIKDYTIIPNDIFLLETGSDLNKCSKYMTHWVKDFKEGMRMTRGFNHLINYCKWRETIEDIYYDSFWLIVSDSKFIQLDTLTSLYEFMKSNPDCGEIHPYIENSPSVYLKKKNNEQTRKESFCEIICPFFSRKAIDLDLFDNRFVYGWGLDFDIPYKLHINNLRLYISNKVGVIHDAGTTTRSGADEQFKNMSDQFNESRNNMIEVLESNYGKDWARKFYSNIPGDVSKDAYFDWVVNIGQNCKKEDLL
jgi:hypothetical protein